jgi:hypothetical protein
MLGTFKNLISCFLLKFEYNSANEKEVAAKTIVKSTVSVCNIVFSLFIAYNRVIDQVKSSFIFSLGLVSS